MTDIDHVRPRTSSHRVALAARRRPSVELMSEGVVAAYLHDISTRHPGTRRVRGGSGPAHTSRDPDNLRVAVSGG
jgi:hypothetical protein